MPDASAALRPTFAASRAQMGAAAAAAAKNTSSTGPPWASAFRTSARKNSTSVDVTAVGKALTKPNASSGLTPGACSASMNPADGKDRPEASQRRRMPPSARKAIPAKATA